MEVGLSGHVLGMVAQDEGEKRWEKTLGLLAEWFVLPAPDACWSGAVD